MDNFSIYYQRGDLTKGLIAGDKLDCTHQCYTPELIWPSRGFINTVDSLDIFNQCSLSVADVGGGANSAGGRQHTNFPKKLHEIERI